MVTKEEFASILKSYPENNVEFGKDLEFLCLRNNCTREEFIQELFSLKNMEIIEKQERNKEERFVIYFIYSKSKGRAYVLRFYPEKVRVITIFPLGKRTLLKYYKRKFKKEEKP